MASLIGSHSVNVIGRTRTSTSEDGQTPSHETIETDAWRDEGEELHQEDDEEHESPFLLHDLRRVVD